jgi:vesicle coat complex subunit
MYDQLKKNKQTDDKTLQKKRKYIDELVINESQIDVCIKLLQDDRSKKQSK